MPDPATFADVRYSVACTVDELVTWLYMRPGPFGFDVEWDSGEHDDYSQRRVVGFALATRDAAVWVDTRNDDATPFLRVVHELCQRAPVWGWSIAGAELAVMRQHGFATVVGGAHHLHGFRPGLHDGMVLAWLAGAGTELDIGLKTLATQLWPAGGPYLRFRDVAKKRPCSAIPGHELGPYCAKDAWLGLKCARHFNARLVREGNAPVLLRHYTELDMPTVAVIETMQSTGLKVAPEGLRELELQLADESARLEARFRQLATVDGVWDADVPMPVLDEQGEPVRFKSGKRKGEVKTKLAPGTVREVRSCNPASPAQLVDFMYHRLGWLPVDKKTAAATDRTTLELLRPKLLDQAQSADTNPPMGTGAPSVLPDAVQAIDALLEWREKSKLLSTYVAPLLRKSAVSSDGRVHGRQAVCGTATQRFAHSGPNFGNLPSRSELGKRVRDAIVAQDGYKIVCCDMSQAELRVAAEVSGDPELTLCYLLDEDVHAGTLTKLHALGFVTAKRTDAKIVNFSSMYGISPPRLAVKARTTLSNGKLMFAAHHERFCGYWAWNEDLCDQVVRCGYVTTLDGFRVRLDPTTEYNKYTRKTGLNWRSRNQAANAVIQGTVGGILKHALLKIEPQLRNEPARLLITEHDSVVFEARADVAEQLGVMVATQLRKSAEVYMRTVPFAADCATGATWAKCK